MLMVFHGVNEQYAESDCDGNERGKRRRGGDPFVVFWWFNLRRGLFCIIIQKNYVQ